MFRTWPNYRIETGKSKFREISCSFFFLIDRLCLVRKWIQSTENAEKPSRGESLIGRVHYRTKKLDRTLQISIKNKY